LPTGLQALISNEMRIWYNFMGYGTVYNPFDVLLFLKKQHFGNFWFESATPSFLIKLLRRKHF